MVLLYVTYCSILQCYDMKKVNMVSNRSKLWKKVKFCGIFRDKFMERSANFAGLGRNFRQTSVKDSR